MLICGQCLGEKSIIHGAVRIPCLHCNEKGYKQVGEDLHVEGEDELN